MFSTLFAIEATEIFLYVIIGVVLLALIVFPIFTNKKRQQTVTNLLNSIAEGDRIKTVGGIIGTVLEVRTTNAVDKEIVVETGEGSTKATMTFDINAVYQVLNKAGAAETPAETEVEAPESPEAETQTVGAGEVSNEPQKSKAGSDIDSIEMPTLDDMEVPSIDDKPAKKTKKN